MFEANLSFRVLEKYLNIALNYGLINQEEVKYKVTDIGREYLEQYKHFEERYVGAQKTLESLSCERERLAQFCAPSKVNKPQIRLSSALICPENRVYVLVWVSYFLRNIQS
jgi:hypothetical protein